MAKQHGNDSNGPIWGLGFSDLVVMMEKNMETTIYHLWCRVEGFLGLQGLRLLGLRPLGLLPSLGSRYRTPSVVGFHIRIFTR